GGTADRNRSHWSTSKTPSYTKSVSWQHHRGGGLMERHPNFSQTLKELLCQQKVSITHQNSGMSGIAA
ncbi:hypothetical protein SNB63_25380, partial [Escherichia coli]|nr:hypothetical protein [Escherichia coli]